MKCPKCGHNIEDAKPVPQDEKETKELAKKFVSIIARQDKVDPEKIYDEFPVLKELQDLLRKNKEK